MGGWKIVQRMAEHTCAASERRLSEGSWKCSIKVG